MTITPETLERIRNNDPTLDTLNLSDNELNPEDVIALAEVLKTNSTLQSLNLSDNDLNPEDPIARYYQWNNFRLNYATTITLIKLLFLGHIMMFRSRYFPHEMLQSLYRHWNPARLEGVVAIAEALKTNSTLNTLDLHKAKLRPKDIRALAEALKTNSTLQSLNLGNNDLEPESVRALAEAITSNYTLLSLHGVESEAITQYIERNHAIHASLISIYTLCENGEFNWDTLDKSFENFIELTPNPSENTLADIDFLSENYRLLNALSHINGGALNEAIQYLEAPFKNKQLQALADKALTHALPLTDAFNTAAPNTRKARNQWLAYQHRNEPKSPLFKMAIYEINHPGEYFTLDKMYSSQDNESQLLPYQILQNTAQQALQSIEDKSTPEALLLLECLKQKEYHRVSIGKLFQSPAFLKTLQQNYPDNTRFQCLETMLFFKNLNRTYNIPADLNTVPPITEASGVSEKYKAAVQSLENNKPQPSLQDKLSETKETLHQFIKNAYEEDEDNPERPSI